MLRGAAVALLSVFLALVLVPAALADTLCDYGYGPYCCNQTAFLRLVQTYKSQWHSEKDFVAYRFQSDGSYTYRHFQPVSSQGMSPFWTYTNSVNALRQTAQQRGGSSSANWEMWEWSLGACS